MLASTFIIITLLSLILFYLGTGKDKRVLWVSIGWILVIGLISYSGYFENTLAKPPRFLFVIVATIGLSLYLYRITRRNSLRTPFLVAVHVLRIPVEVTLYQLFLQEKVPIIMTFKGYNFDILVGISAMILLAYMLLSRKNPLQPFFLWWNVAGILFLATIVVTAILSSPLPIQQLAFDQPNTAVLTFPFSFLPAYIVPIVLLSHLLTISKR